MCLCRGDAEFRAAFSFAHGGSHVKVRKEIIPPGVYTYLHGQTKQPAKLTVTAKDNDRYARICNEMLAAGLSIPVPLEHQPDAVPMTPSQKAAWQTKFNTGWVEKFAVEGGKLFADLDIADEDVAKKLPHTIKFVSPHINSFLDGNGRQWDNVITHVALTTRPRITNQSPFPNMAAALSMFGGMPCDTPHAAVAASQGVSLSAAGLLDPMGKPVYPIAFSLATGVKLSGEDLDDVDAKPKPKAKVETEVEDDEDDSVIEPEVTTPPVVDVDGDGDADAGDLKIEEACLHLLKVLGYNPPPMNAATFKRDLYETLMTAIQDKVSKAEGSTEGDESGDGTDKIPLNDAPIVQESPNLFASLEEVQAITDPKLRQLAEWGFAQKQRADAAALSIINDFEKGRQKRIDRLCKRLPETSRVKLKEKLTAMQSQPGAALSLGNAGDVNDPLDATLSVLEIAIPNVPSLLRTPGGANTVPQPRDGEMTAERAKEIVDEVQGARR